MDDREILLPTVHRNRIIVVEARVDATAVLDVKMEARWRNQICNDGRY